MKYRRYVILGAVLGVLLVGTLQVFAAEQSECLAIKTPWCVQPRVQPSLDLVGEATVPKLAVPSWMTPPAPTEPRVVTYTVSSRGTVESLDEFALIVRQTMADSQGWSRLGVSWRQVESGGDVTFFLVQSSQMMSFGPECSPGSNCTVGRAMAINQALWKSAPNAWKKAGGDQAEYHTYAINHEAGHWLGHGNATCTTKQLAPVMQPAESIGTCQPNAWPLSRELYAPSLGVSS